MGIDWANQGVSFAGTMIATLIGVGGAYVASDALARKQARESARSALEAYLRLFLTECQENRRILKEVLSYLKGSSPVERAFEPVEAASRHLRYSAWDALVRAALFENLGSMEQVILSKADYAVRRADRVVGEVTAEWRMVYQRYTLVGFEPQGDFYRSKYGGDLVTEKKTEISRTVNEELPALEDAINYLETLFAARK